MVVKVAINGYGTIGKRVADAIDAQTDMEIIGVTRTRMSFGCNLAVHKGYPLYCTFNDADRIAVFKQAGYNCKSFLSGLLKSADIVLDCSPRKAGAQSKAMYKNINIKWIFQGDKKRAMTGLSYTSSGNHTENIN